MIDLSTTYLGLQLRTPLVASASPLSQEIDGIRRLEDAVRPPWCCTRCSKSSCGRKASSLNITLLKGQTVLQRQQVSSPSPMNSGWDLTARGASLDA
jgi:hypothetical protein